MAQSEDVLAVGHLQHSRFHDHRRDSFKLGDAPVGYRNLSESQRLAGLLRVVAMTLGDVLLHQVTEHHDAVDPLGQDHLPKVDRRRLHGSLSADVLLGVRVEDRHVVGVVVVRRVAVRDQDTRRLQADGIVVAVGGHVRLE